MYTYIYIHVCIYIHTYIYIYIYIHKHMHDYTHMPTTTLNHVDGPFGLAPLGIDVGGRGAAPRRHRRALGGRTVGNPYVGVPDLGEAWRGASEISGQSGMHIYIYIYMYTYTHTYTHMCAYQRVQVLTRIGIRSMFLYSYIHT